MNALFLLMSNALAEGEQRSDFWLPEQASTLSSEIDTTFYFIYYVSAVFFVVLMGAMIWFALAYKQKSEGERTLDLKGSHKIEFAWAVFPSFLLITMFVMGFKTYIRSTVPPAESIEIRVEAWQWAWGYRYPRYGIELGAEESLVVPVNTPVRLQMSSKDVLHSYYVPDFRVKKDVVPNRYSTVWFEANDLYSGKIFQRHQGKIREGTSSTIVEISTDTVVETILGRAKKEGLSLKKEDIKVGTHQVFCTEYCGDDHSRMLTSIVVLQQEHFDLWVKGTTSFDPYEKYKSDAEVGAYLAGKKGCTGCHNAKEAKDGAGPSWVGLFGKERKFTNADSTVADENYIRESILNPDAKIVANTSGDRYGVMNGGWDKLLTERDIDAIVAYIKSIK
jgi:cytochrome c oxidase subunit II